MNKLIYILCFALFGCGSLNVIPYNDAFETQVLLYGSWRRANRSFNKIQKGNYVKSRYVMRNEYFIFIPIEDGDLLTNVQLLHWYGYDFINKVYNRKL